MESSSGSSDELDIRKIPDVFYGGNNPVIYEPTIDTSSSVGASTIVQSPRPTSPLLVSSPVSAAHLKPVSTKKFFWAVGILGTLVVLGASVYFFLQYQSSREQGSDTNTVRPSTTFSQPTTTSNTTLVTTPLLNTSSSFVSVTSTPTTTAPSLTSSFLQFPPVNMGTSADVDLDLLTDIEEALYSLDSGRWDTDGDGYYDGQEIANLYNPRGAAPVKLIDSGLVREYINPFAEYRLYYPISWQSGGVDDESRHVLFSAMGGEYVEVRVFEKNPSVTFQQWFQVEAGTEQFNLLIPFVNRFGVEGFRRNDNLVAYVDVIDFVFVFSYHQPDARAPIVYRSTFEMMYQGFRPSANTAVLPPQIPLEIPEDVPTTNTSTSSTL